MRIELQTAVVNVGASEQTQVSSAASEPVSSESLAPDPVAQLALSDDAIYEIAALVAQSAAGDRKNARVQRNASERRIEEQTAKRIEALHDKADAMRTAAAISGATGMAGGLCQVAGGVSSMKEATQIQTTGKAEDGSLTPEQNKQNKIVETNAAAYAPIGNGLGGMFQAGGAGAAGFFQASSEEFGADAALHESKAARAERAVDQHNEEMKDAKALQDKVMEFLKDVRASQNASAQAAIRG